MQNMSPKSERISIWTEDISLKIGTQKVLPHKILSFVYVAAKMAKFENTRSSNFILVTELSADNPLFIICFFLSYAEHHAIVEKRVVIAKRE